MTTVRIQATPGPVGATATSGNGIRFRSCRELLG